MLIDISYLEFTYDSQTQTPHWDSQGPDFMMSIICSSRENISLLSVGGPVACPG